MISKLFFSNGFLFKFFFFLASPYLILIHFFFFRCFSFFLWYWLFRRVPAISWPLKTLLIEQLISAQLNSTQQAARHMKRKKQKWKKKLTHICPFALLSLGLRPFLSSNSLCLLPVYSYSARSQPTPATGSNPTLLAPRWLLAFVVACSLARSAALFAFIIPLCAVERICSLLLYKGEVFYMS